MKDLEIAKRIVEVLDRAWEADPEAIAALIENRVLCNIDLAKDPTIQVGIRPDRKSYEVGLLGILNGIAGVHPDNKWGYVAAMYNEGNLRGFKIVEDWSKV